MTRTFDDYDRLEECILRLAARRPRLLLPMETEQSRRAAALQSIDEILEWKPLRLFSANQLELLATMFAYWREAEVEVPGVVEPDASTEEYSLSTSQ